MTVTIGAHATPLGLADILGVDIAGLDWQARGMCTTDPDPDQWYPVGYGGPYTAQVADVKAVCAVCPVRAQCLDWAITTGEQHGIAGGMTPDERGVERRRRAGRVCAAAGCRNAFVLRPDNPTQRYCSRSCGRSAPARVATHCRHGHDLAGDGSFVNARGHRRCRVCRDAVNARKNSARVTCRAADCRRRFVPRPGRTTFCSPACEQQESAGVAA